MTQAFVESRALVVHHWQGETIQDNWHCLTEEEVVGRWQMAGSRLRSYLYWKCGPPGGPISLSLHLVPRQWHVFLGTFRSLKNLINRYTARSSKI